MGPGGGILLNLASWRQIAPGDSNVDTGGEFKMPVATLALPVDSFGASGSGCTED